ncbi:hypothetical protein OZ410_03420 [Robiginitalea sp. M366]|uniref:hypothetical protein n=1 Tax=Robiginitalea aestuariiviva TaxID=3036903 RepID=UPI00240E91E7|nr:hypothetical protein [Robiginitalea aestuariiviva]MDG1571349.1 hypothetical protein [Robiginitalea aestuariiviva]
MKYLPVLWVTLLMALFAQGQEMPVEYRFGEKYSDRYKYSNLLNFSEVESGEKLLVRAYYTGIVLRPKGYLIERYNAQLELLDEYNYKFRGADFVDGFTANGQIYLLFLEYDPERLSYIYTVHQSPVGAYNFTQKVLLTVPSVYVDNALDKNYFNRKFNSGFTTTVLFDREQRAFAISLHYKKGKDDRHRILVYNYNLRPMLDVDFSGEIEEKNYAFEALEMAPDLSAAFLIGKAYFKKRRFKAEERRFQYELVKLTPGGSQTATYDVPGKYAEGLKPIWKGNTLVCVGFYADRKDNRYNGLQYFEVDPVSLEGSNLKYNPFSEQFMFDKFGTEDEKVVKNLAFKEVRFDAQGNLLFNAEEYFVTRGMEMSPSGGRVQVERFHHNDIVSVKLDPQGRLVWARNINKTEVTQNDGAYISYSAFTKDGNTYFFISSAADNPQLLNNERLIFRQGLSRNRNIFLIRLDAQGQMSYEKIISHDEARLPMMVSQPLIRPSEDTLFFYAKRGGKKQLVAIQIQG